MFFSLMFSKIFFLNKMLRQFNCLVINISHSAPRNPRTVGFIGDRSRKL